VLKAECLDLPPKLYQRVLVEMSDEQRRVYRDLRRDYIAEMKGHELVAELALVRMTRLQQIAGGFFPYDKGDTPIPFDTNPKLSALVDLVEERQQKTIIWSRYRAEIAAIAARLTDVWGLGTVEFLHGGLKDANDRVRNFQRDDKVRAIVGQPRAGGYGFTLTAADLVVYYSNDLSLETRLQSEDRAHRIGQRNAVTYVDMVCEGTVDVKVAQALVKKLDISREILQDPIEEWL
jgi:SNF2 family DNA or RNA helicase